MQDLKDSLDGVLITGDIATTGLDFDLEKALVFIEGIPDSSDSRTSGGFPTISSMGLPVHLLPGNHDRYKLRFSGLGYAPGGRKFHQVFHAHWQDDVKQSSVVKSDLAVGIIAADFSLQKTRHAQWRNLVVNAYSQGKAYQDIVDKCVIETQKFQQEYDEKKDVFIIWAMHFPPIPEQKAPYMRLLHREAVISAANQNSVALILSGHTHDPFDFSSPRNNFRAFGTGSTTQDDSPEGNFCQQISIENSDDGYWLEIMYYRFDEPAGRFVKV